MVEWITGTFISVVYGLGVFLALGCLAAAFVFTSGSHIKDEPHH